MTMPQSNLVASQSVDRAAFENLYAGPAPWDIGKPQPAFVAVADRVTGPVLDAGCGTGEHALFLAARGLRVVGVDFVEEAIRRARARAADRGLLAEFLVKDATAPAGRGEGRAGASYQPPAATRSSRALESFYPRPTDSCRSTSRGGRA